MALQKGISGLNHQAQDMVIYLLPLTLEIFFKKLLHFEK